MRVFTTILTVAALLVSATQSVFLEVNLAEHPEQANQITEMTVNDMVSVHLQENPTTGYSWILANRPKDPVLKFAKKMYFPHKSQDEVFGAGGETYYDFRAMKHGADTVDFIYCQVFAMEQFIDKKTGTFNWQAAMEQNLPIQHIAVKFNVTGNDADANESVPVAFLSY
jgi:predicted secreted protein